MLVPGNDAVSPHADVHPLGTKTRGKDSRNGNPRVIIDFEGLSVSWASQLREVAKRLQLLDQFELVMPSFSPPQFMLKH